MKTKLILALGLSPLVISAGEKTPLEVPSEAPSWASQWTFGGGLSTRFNLEASFKGLGAWQSPHTPLPLGPGVDRTYDDGYNRIDSSGNVGGLTNFFGVNNLSQIDQVTPGTISMNINNSLNTAAVTQDDSGPHAGLDFYARLEVNTIEGIGISGLPPARWGWNFGVFYQYANIDNSTPLTSSVSRVTDTFGPPTPAILVTPYSGPFTGPGPLLSDTPARSTSLIPGGATVLGSREITALLFGFNVGPWVAIPVSDHATIIFETGLTLAIAHGKYEFSSVTTIPGAGPQTTTGTDRSTTILPGIYIGGALDYQINEQWSANVGLRYSWLDDLSVSALGSTAEMSFDGSFVLSTGFTYRY